MMNATLEETRAGEAVEQLFRVPLYQGNHRVGSKQVWAVDATAAWATVTEQLEQSELTCQPQASSAGATPGAEETQVDTTQPQAEPAEDKIETE